MNLFDENNRQRNVLLDRLKEKYPIGQRVELVRMAKPQSSYSSGLQGTVRKINPDGGLRVNWDNGVSSTIEYGTDDIKPINQKKQKK